MSEEVNYEFGEVSVESKVGSTGHATPAEIVEIGRKMWKKIVESKVSVADEAATDRLLVSIQNEFKDFNLSFPLVVRWAVQLRKFNPTALEKYLRLHATADLNSREGFLKLQSEYLVLMFREENSKRHDEKAVQRYREHLQKELLAEDKAFIEAHKLAEEEAAKDAASVDVSRRQNLYKTLMAQKLGDAAKP